MIGRDEAVATICGRLRDHRFASIVGPGGIGKTTVAIATAHAMLAEFEAAVSFVDFASLADPLLVANTLASRLGIAAQTSDPTPSLIASLVNRRLLLVLDNCEHLADAIAPLAERIFAETHDVHILATSREALRVEGEHVHRLEPLEIPREQVELTAARAMEFAAVQLFVERAAAGGAQIELSDQDAPVVARICRGLDGLALAIELAAGRVNAHGLRGTAALLDSRFRLQWQGRRTALPRHQTLTSMLDWSYRLLSEAEQRVLRRLSIFVGPFRIADAEAVVPAEGESDLNIPAMLADLVERSLVSTVIGDGEVSYRLLETTRAYALAKLGESGEGDALAARQAGYLVGWLRNADVTSPAIRRTEALALAAHLGNIRSGLEWCFSDRGQASIGIVLVAAAAPLFLKLSLLGECLNWTEQALSVLPQSGRDTALELDLKEALAISTMFTKGNGEEVRDAIMAGLALAEKLGDNTRRTRMLAGLSIFYTRISDFRSALDVAEQSAAVARSEGDTTGIVMAEWMLGVSQHLIGDQVNARANCEAGLAHAAEHPGLNTNFFGYDHRIRALVALARALWLLGFPERALAVAQQTLDEAAAEDRPVTTCIALIYTSSVFLWCGDHATAEDIIERLIAHAGRHGLTPYHAVGLGLKGELSVRSGNVAPGIELLHRALDVLDKEQHSIQFTTFKTALAEAQCLLGHYDRALKSIEEALSVANTCDRPEMLRVKGHVLAAMNRPEAEASLREALQLAQSQSALGWELRAATSLGRLMAGQGAREPARELLAGVYARFREGFETSDLLDVKAVMDQLIVSSN
jgi:predicted ATPase